MKRFNMIFAGIISIMILLILLCNIVLMSISENSGREYRVEANRAANTILNEGIGSVDISEYSCITAIIKMDNENKEDFYNPQSDYVIRKIGNEIYRIEYTPQNNQAFSHIIIIINIILFIFVLLITVVIIYIRQKILKPFFLLRNAPYELSRGNLTIPIKENKNKFFGKFTWGIDLLREKLEQSKKQELKMQKDKKTLLLSLSHDIKTPLSAIKLYSKALTKGLYNDAEKQIEIAGSIDRKADEIEKFVSEIIKASRDDFIHIEVNEGEFYMSAVIDKIIDYYKEKLMMNSTDFLVGDYSDCLLKGDPNRIIEVIQNIMENALKYGDGKSVSIEFSEEEYCRLITVKNSGCTLSDTELPHIFDSFWRGSNTGNQEGSGLGLYICRQIMHKMNGDVFAEIKNGYMCVTAVVAEA